MKNRNFLGFPKKLINSLVCPNDGEGLLFKSLEDNKTHIIKGNLFCPKCGTNYKIDDGILHLISVQSPMSKIMKEEAISRDKKARNYDERLAPRYYREVVPTLKRLNNPSNKKIIEYGCGTGRFTLQIANRCKLLLAIDFSLGSLMSLTKKVKSNPNIGLVLADATQFITKSKYFDIAFSSQFIEHIPNPKQRANFLVNAHKSLKDRGVFLSTLYHYDLRRRLRRAVQEGFHKNKIFFHYFSAKETKRELGRLFKIKQFRFIDITPPLIAKLVYSNKLRGLISNFCSKIFPLNRLGHLILVKAIKK